MAMYPSPTPASLPSKPQKGHGALIALIALVLLCGLAGAALAILTLNEQPQAEATAEASDPPARVAAIPVNNTAVPVIEPLVEPLPVEDEPADVSVSIVTDPPGAEVFRGGEFVGVTPVQTRFARAAKSEKWQLFLTGFEVEELEVGLDADFHSELILRKLAPTAVAVPRPTPTDPASNNNGGGTTSKPSTDGTGKKPNDGKKPKGDNKKPDPGPRTVIKGSGVAVPD